MDTIILVDAHGDAVTWAGATTPIFDFTYDDIAKFATVEEAEDFAATLALETYISELHEEFASE